MNYTPRQVIALITFAMLAVCACALRWPSSFVGVLAMGIVVAWFGTRRSGA